MCSDSGKLTCVQFSSAQYCAERRKVTILVQCNCKMAEIWEKRVPTLNFEIQILSNFAFSNFILIIQIVFRSTWRTLKSHKPHEYFWGRSHGVWVLCISLKNMCRLYGYDESKLYFLGIYLVINRCFNFYIRLKIFWKLI